MVPVAQEAVRFSGSKSRWGLRISFFCKELALEKLIKPTILRRFRVLLACHGPSPACSMEEGLWSLGRGTLNTFISPPVSSGAHILLKNNICVSWALNSFIISFPFVAFASQAGD